MAPLPNNSTAAYFVAYTTGRYEHKLQVRIAPGTTPAAVDLAVAEFLSEFKPIMPQGWRVLGVTFRGSGDVASFPVAMPLTEAVDGDNAAQFVPAAEEPRALTYVGRSNPGGRRVRVSLYGLIFATPASYRFPAGTEGDPTNEGLQALEEANGNGVFVCIDGDVPVWSRYADVNYNSYWEAEVRA